MTQAVEPSPAGTADPHGARSHARAMEGIRVEAMPVVPASDAVGLPPGVPAEAAVWEETIAAGGYASRQLARGSRLRLVDLHGDACVSLLIFNAERPVERLNVADTVKVQWNAYLRAGRLLLSDMGRVLMSLLEDEAQTHDAFCGASNEASNARRYGDGANYGTHPNARDRFRIALAKYGLGRKDIHPCVNLFKGVSIGADGTTNLNCGPFPPGRALTLRAEMDVIVVLANCPHVLDPRPSYSVTPVRATAWRGAVTPESDPIRIATPEGRRAFLNTEDYYRR
jgi:urea carboxylase-associated protein 2